MTDKGYDSAANRAACRRRGIAPVIPHRENAKNKPTFLPKTALQDPRPIEQTIGKLKRFKRIAMRCDKTAGQLRRIRRFCLRPDLGQIRPQGLGWRSQYAAMLRWHGRCESRHNGQCYTSRVDALDFMLAFFVVCYHLRDYAIETGKISQREIDRLIGKNRYMRICRDVCNRSKHHTLTGKASIDRDWSIGREYVPWSDGDEKLFLIADEKYDAIDVVRG